VHVSPQRFASVSVAGSSPCGLTVTLKGVTGETVKHTCIDAHGTVHTAQTAITADGSATAMV
jgi:hypothetical protein